MDWARWGCCGSQNSACRRKGVKTLAVWADQHPTGCSYSRLEEQAQTLAVDLHQGDSRFACRRRGWKAPSSSSWGLKDSLRADSISSSPAGTKCFNLFGYCPSDSDENYLHVCQSFTCFPQDVSAESSGGLMAALFLRAKTWSGWKSRYCCCLDHHFGCSTWSAAESRTKALGSVVYLHLPS